MWSALRPPMSTCFKPNIIHEVTATCGRDICRIRGGNRKVSYVGDSFLSSISRFRHTDVGSIASYKQYTMIFNAIERHCILCQLKYISQSVSRKTNIIIVTTLKTSIMYKQDTDTRLNVPLTCTHTCITLLYTHVYNFTVHIRV